MFINLMVWWKKKKRNHDQSEVGQSLGPPSFAREGLRLNSGEVPDQAERLQGRAIHPDPPEASECAKLSMHEGAWCVSGNEGSQGASVQGSHGENSKKKKKKIFCLCSIWQRCGENRHFYTFWVGVQILGRKLVLYNKIKMCPAFDLSTYIQEFIPQKYSEKGAKIKIQGTAVLFPPQMGNNLNSNIGDCEINHVAFMQWKKSYIC